MSGSLLAIQRSHTDNPGEFVPWITTQQAFTEYEEDPFEKCHAAALDMESVMQEEHIPYEVLVFIMWDRDDNDSVPLDHVVVVATVDNTRIVVDPTRGQFKGLKACALEEHQWRTEFLGAHRDCGVAVKTFTQAKTANYFGDKRVTYGWDPKNVAKFEVDVLQLLPERQQQVPQDEPELVQQRQQKKGCCVIL